MMVIDHLAKSAQISIIMITDIEYLTIIKSNIKENRSKINAYERQKRKNDCKFNLSCKIRQKTNYAFKSHINKMNTLIACSNYHLRKWIIYQLYCDISLENYRKIWCLDHCYPL